MVRERGTKESVIAKVAMTKGMRIIGRGDLVHRKVTQTIDENGKLIDQTTSDTTFRGDLQTGPDIDTKFISAGVVEVGEAVLYIHPDALTTLPVAQDLIVVDSAEWEIISQLEGPEIGSKQTFYAFRCRRRVVASDT